MAVVILNNGAFRAEILDHDFERLQAVFAQGLLGHPGGQVRGAVGLLVVGDEVLDVGIHAVLLRAR